MSCIVRIKQAIATSSPLSRVLAAYCALSCLLVIAWGGDLLQVAAFLLYQLVVLHLSGRGLACALRYRAESDIELFAVSYGLGFAWSTALYFAVRLLGSLALFWPLQAAAALCALFLFAKRPIAAPQASVREAASFATLLVAVTLLLFFCYAMANYAPEASENSFYRDNGYYIGNTVELKIEFPPRDFRSIFYDTYSYHYLPSAQLALMSWVSGIPAFDLTFGFSYVQGALLLCSSSFALFKSLSSSSGFALALSAILLLGTGFESYTTVNYLSHLYVASFGFDISLAFSMLFMLVTVRLTLHGQQNEHLLIPLALSFFVMLFGSKGPFGILALVFSCVLCVRALARRDIKGSVVFGLCLLLCALVLYVLLMRDTTVRTIVGDTSSRGIATVENFKGIYLALTGLPLPSVLTKFVYAAFYTVCCNPSVLGLFGVGLFCVVRHRAITAAEGAFAIASCAGIALLCCVTHSGFSQMYFLLGAYPYMLALFASVIGEQRNAYTKDQRFYLRVWRTPSAVMPCIVSVALGASLALSCASNYRNSIGENVSKGLQHLVRMETTDDVSDDSGYASNLVEPSLYEALVWLRENTAPQAVCVSDDPLVSTSNTYPYYPAVIAERHFYMPFESNDPEMFSHVQHVFDGTATESDWTALARRDISYRVQHNTDRGLGAQYGRCLHAVFSTDDVIVYEITAD